MSFYPKPDDPRHKKLVGDIKEVCTELNARCIDMVRYYDGLPEGDAESIKGDFSHEALWTRTLPDLFIRPAEPASFYLDVKTSDPKYPNISIELSSFYWTFRRNMPDSRGVKCNHLYAVLDRDSNICVFSPLLTEILRVNISPFHWFKGERVPWSPEEIELFRHYAECITQNPRSIQEKETEGGTGDPFVLIPKESLKSHMKLYEFLLNHQERSNYLRKKGSAATDLGRFFSVGGS